MYRMVEIITILALAATGGFVLAQGGILPAIMAFGAAFVFAVPKLHNAEEAEHGK
ncbi:hypothetical protein [Paenibacillus apiarius]|uniref:hypothetical protein n=1 Tax=Paenibacillus apiarius TaxID=46240 RepID=UPI003B3A3F5B